MACKRVLALMCGTWKLSKQTVTGGEMHDWLVTPTALAVAVA
jgi:hypothetical protein